MLRYSEYPGFWVAETPNCVCQCPALLNEDELCMLPRNKQNSRLVAEDEVKIKRTAIGFNDRKDEPLKMPVLN